MRGRDIMAARNKQPIFLLRELKAAHAGEISYLNGLQGKWGHPA